VASVIRPHRAADSGGFRLVSATAAVSLSLFLDGHRLTLPATVPRDSATSRPRPPKAATTDGSEGACQVRSSSQPLGAPQIPVFCGVSLKDHPDCVDLAGGRWRGAVL